MAYNSHGKRIRSENLAGQVTTTAWDQFACTSVDELISAAKNAKSAKHAYAYDAAGRRISCAHSGLAFTSPDTNAYLYNTRSELTNATAAVDSAYRYTYDFDDIGNRKTSAERGTNSVYTASQLNQYAAVDDFTPTYDADGNETIVKTATGIWNVTYNGENRPVRWTQGDTVITMSFDRMGRRVTKNDQRFVYNDYLQIASFHSTTTTSDYNYFVWDPTEPVATRPLAWQRSALSTQHSTLFYTHDGNKNVSEVIASDTDVAAHYEYAPFGAMSSSCGEFALVNPFRYSSEHADDDIGLIYYNYRYLDAMNGRWITVDPVYDSSKYLFVLNDPLSHYDILGLKDDYLPDIPEVAPELGVSYQFDANEIAKHLRDVNMNLNKHKHVNQVTPKCPDTSIGLGLGIQQWVLRKRNIRTRNYDYPLFNQRFHVEFDAAEAFTIGAGISRGVWGVSGTRRVEKRNHVSIIGLIEVNQRVVQRSYEWNCECVSSLYAANNGSFYYSIWHTYYEDPSYYFVGKWLAARMAVTPMDGKSTWSVEGHVGGISVSYGEE